MRFSYLFTICSWALGQQVNIGFEAVALQHCDVASVVVGPPLLPHSPNDPLPLIGQLTHRLVVAQLKQTKCILNEKMTL